MLGDSQKFRRIETCVASALASEWPAFSRFGPSHRAAGRGCRGCERGIGGWIGASAGQATRVCRPGSDAGRRPALRRVLGSVAGHLSSAGRGRRGRCTG